jgi:hypothetical protein
MPNVEFLCDATVGDDVSAISRKGNGIYEGINEGNLLIQDEALGRALEDNYLAEVVADQDFLIDRQDQLGIDL